ncbi:hypothetical protein SAMN02787142_2104 [Burkholderia sp. WP9]|uniref:hypothetical protein n=1 Tax=Burkholderia sp. WP9 TaxID=1500263 RepID=UPI00089C67F9|nr:hypothetical protein [Burkholderia sp. WP9]SEC87266.1 hypothetical protein SAMN02787142_2104 [Burkholderia sp. WP9]
MTFNTLLERKVRTTITVVRPDASGEATPDVYTFASHRQKITVRNGGAQFNSARVEIYGAPLDTMNQIARLWNIAMAPQNTDTLQIDVWDGWNYIPLFAGVISWSTIEARQPPNVYLVVEANASFALGNMAVSPYANPGPVALQDVLTSVITPAGFSLDYSSAAINPLMNDVRLTGSPLEQITQAIGHYPQLRFAFQLQRLVVTAVGQPFTADPILISPRNGMMGGPAFSSSSLQLATIFNPRIRQGVAIEVETEFTYVNQTAWLAAVVVHQLEPNVPGGAFTTSIACSAWGTAGNNQQ